MLPSILRGNIYEYIPRPNIPEAESNPWLEALFIIFLLVASSPIGVYMLTWGHFTDIYVYGALLGLLIPSIAVIFYTIGYWLYQKVLPFIFTAVVIIWMTCTVNFPKNQA